MEENKENLVKKDKIKKKRKTIKELFENYDGKYEKVEIDWGDEVGEERWWEKMIGRDQNYLKNK